MAVDLGSTFDCPDGDMHPRMPLLTDAYGKARGWLQALARRVAAIQGSLWYDKNYGLGLSNMVDDDEDPEVAAELINQTFKQDERCASCETTISVTAGGANGDTWRVTSDVKTQDGQVYQFVWLASADKAELLSATQGT